jgi:hypothetical protein
MSDAERARQAVGLRTFNEVWGAMLEDVIGMWALNAPDLDDVLDVLADHSHEVEASLPAQAVEPGPLTSDSAQRLAKVIEQAEATNPEWARGARFVVGWYPAQAVEPSAERTCAECGRVIGPLDWPRQ